MTILDNIIEAKRIHVAECKKNYTPGDMEKHLLFSREPVSLRDRLMQPESSGIIAEFKRKSPSKGIINDRVIPEIITLAYEEAGVAGVSILTDQPFFGGTSEDLTRSRHQLSIPILRKDFIIDEFQIVEAKTMGADVILLIAAVLSKEEVKAFAGLAKSLGMEVLFEVHDKEELDKICDDVTMVGINNRNLKTFKVDIQQSIELANILPGEFLKISESGIDNVGTIKTLKREGFSGFLIGENFMRSPNPGEACKNFITELRAL